MISNDLALPKISGNADTSTASAPATVRASPKANKKGAKSGGYMPNKAATEDWCTPPEIRDAVRRVVGRIDLDPCGNPYSIVGAKEQVWLPSWLLPVAADPENKIEGRPAFEPTPDVTVGDGLQVPWTGHVYVNPPYGAALDAFMDRAVAATTTREAESVSMLIPSKTSRKCWQRTAPFARAVLFIDGRVTFLIPGGDGYNAPFPSALLLWTRDIDLVARFGTELGGAMGHVMAPL